MANMRVNAFLRGFGGMFSFVDALNRRLLAESPAEAQAEALRETWEEVGGHLYDATGSFEVEYEANPTNGSDKPACKEISKNKQPLRE